MTDNPAANATDASSNRVGMCGPDCPEEPDGCVWGECREGLDALPGEAGYVPPDAIPNSAAVIAASLWADSYYHGGKDDARLLADSILAALGRVTPNSAPRIRGALGIEYVELLAWFVKLPHGQVRLADEAEAAEARRLRYG